MSTQYETYRISSKRSASITDSEPVYGTLLGATVGVGAGEQRKGSVVPQGAASNGYHVGVIGPPQSITKSEGYEY